jgi:hypothetical protein
MIALSVITAAVARDRVAKQFDGRLETRPRPATQT